MKSHKVLIIGSIITVIILTGAVLLYWYVLRAPLIVIQSSPDAVSITVDGVAATSHNVKSTPGAHTVAVSAENFVTYTIKVNLKRAQSLVLPIVLKQIPSPISLSSNVTDGPIFAKGTTVYFIGNGGKTLYQTVAEAGQTNLNVSAITPDTLPTDISKIIWRPDASLAFLKRPDGVYLYDFQRNDLLHQTNTLWGTGIDDIIWDPAGVKVMYTYYGANGEQSLTMADIQNKNTTKVANLAQQHIDHPSLQWSPDGNYVLMVDRSAQKNTNYLYVYNVFTRTIKQLTATGQVSGAKWSPDSAYIAYVAPGADSSGTSMLWVVKNDGSTVTPLNIATASIDKVAWVNDSSGLAVSKPTAGGNDTLYFVSVNGDATPYQYNGVSGVFTPNHLLNLPTDNRILYFNQNQLFSLSLISPNY